MRSLASRTFALGSLVAFAACAPDTSLTSPADAAVENPSLAAAAAQGNAPDFVPGEVLVKFRAGASASNRGAAMRAANSQAGEHIVTGAMRRAGDNEGVTVLHTPMGVGQAIDALIASGAVEYAEPNWIYRSDALPSTSELSQLWGMKSAPGINAVAAWNRTGSASCDGVWVGIIDEGYYYQHVDLAANAGVVDPQNGIDDDGNGLVDDTYGWDFANNDRTVFDGTTDDHGSHVAGTIGAQGGNGTGVAGVCSSVKIVSAKFLGRNGGTTANAIKAVDYMTDLKSRGFNIVATNNSWGGGGFSQALQDAITRAGNANILFIAAAGNSSYNCDTSTACYPAEYPNANLIAVASITSTGALSSFSNYGATTVDIGAPGSGIYSTVPVQSKGQLTSGYATYSGTSMATPHVTGSAALYAARHPGSTAAQIKAALLGSATDGSLSGKVLTGGRVNVGAF
jgi:subtilisin family serine protease